MFNNYKVMSKKEIEQFSKESHDFNSIVISITNSFDVDAKISCSHQNKIINILRLYFDDVLFKEITQDSKFPNIWFDKFGRSLSPINEQDCNNIYQFIMEFYRKSEEYTLIVHCEMGVSRSSAVMGAILKALTDDDMLIFKNNKFRPNPDVYRMVLNKFMEYKYEIDMNIDSPNNLRFNELQTPYGYSPKFAKVSTDKTNKIDKTSSETQTIFAPSLFLTSILPELKEVKEKVQSFVGRMPKYYFHFASIVKDEETGKKYFYSYFEKDKDLNKNSTKTSGYKETIAYQLIKLLKERKLPDVYRENTTQDIKGKKNTVKNYYIVLYNINSPYFYQKSIPFNLKKTDKITHALVEMEYTFENGYKTWEYYPVNSEEANNIYRILGYVCFQGVHLRENNSDFSKSFFWKNDKDEQVVIITQTDKGETAQLVFSFNDWASFNLGCTGIRIVNFTIK